MGCVEHTSQLEPNSGPNVEEHMASGSNSWDGFPCASRHPAIRHYRTSSNKALHVLPTFQAVGLMFWLEWNARLQLSMGGVSIN